MLIQQSVLRPIAVCGLWFALCGSVIGQNNKAKNETSPNAPNSIGSAPSRLENRQPGNDPNRPYNDPNSRSTGPAGSTGYPGGSQNVGLSQNTGYSSGPQGPYTSYTVYGPQPQEMMIYQEGEFKVVTQNLNDPKTIEASRECNRVVAEVVQTLRSDKSSDELHAEAKKTMNKYLEAHFDHDHNKRRQQLESLEAQVVKLKAQLEKRSQSKEQLIELRLKLLENDASGLAFPQAWTQVPGLETYSQPVIIQGVPSPGASPMQTTVPYLPGTSNVPGIQSFAPATSYQAPSYPAPAVGR